MDKTTMQTEQTRAEKEPRTSPVSHGTTWHMVFFIGLLLLVPLLQAGALAWYTIDKALEHTVLDAVYEGSDLLREPARWYLTYTDRIYHDGKPSPDLLSFTLNQYGQRGTDRATVLALAKSFRQRGADINAYNHRGNTVLHEAVLLQQVELVQFLLENGADPAKKTKHSPPPNARTDGLSALGLARWLQVNSKIRGDWGPVIDTLTISSPQS